MAQWVRESINSVPPFDGMQLRVNEHGIIRDTVGGRLWWRVPVIPTPQPRRQSALYEALAEIEGDLQDRRGLDVLLFIGNDPEPATNGAH